MSLGLWLRSQECPTCRTFKETESLDYTYNVSKMWREVYPESKNMVDIDGMKGKDSISILHHAIEIMIKDSKKFIEMNPPSGWGSYHTFMEFLVNLIELAKLYPDWIWYSDR
jgi:hypothetical protein